MPHQTEPSASNALGNILQAMLGKAVVRPENHQVIEDYTGLQPRTFSLRPVVASPSTSPPIPASSRAPSPICPN